MTWALRGAVIGDRIRGHLAAAARHGARRQPGHACPRVVRSWTCIGQAVRVQSRAAAAGAGAAGDEEGEAEEDKVVGLYELLGVHERASAAEIKVAYRHLARLHHPDVNTETSLFQIICQAYSVLSQEELRKQYNEQGFNSLNSKEYKELLAFFGIGEEAARPASYMGKPPVRGEDVFTVVGLPLDETVTGTKRTVTIDVRKSCLGCEGRGVVHSSKPPVCHVCRGRRTLLRTVRRPDVLLRFVKLGDCPACAGKGVQTLPPCPRCSGDGRGPLSRLGVQVSVPAGVSDADVLRIKGQGNTGRYGGQPGDLYIKLQVHPCDNLERRGQDLHSSLDLDLYDALLGGRLPVTTPRGHKLLAVPEGTQVGDVLCLEHGGVATASQGVTSWGHHFFTVRVVVPDSSDMGSPEVELLQSLSKLVGSRVSPWW